MPSISLSHLFNGFPGNLTGGADLTAACSGIAIDSRTVKPGDVFVCLRGSEYDGHSYARMAVQHGATAVVGDRELSGLGVPYLRVPDARRLLGDLAACLFGRPARKLTVIGVTGTDGKTTTTNLIYQVLLAAGIRAGMISTVNAVIGDRVLDTGLHVTTPDAHDIQRYLAAMVEAGLTHVVLETTSHGWAQHRVDACEFDIGVLTNITHEHLDQHGSFEAYRDAKARLFTGLAGTSAKPSGNPRLAVLNADDASFHYLRQLLPGPVISYSASGKADLCAEAVRGTADGLSFGVSSGAGRWAVASHLHGRYNVSNCLAAWAATVAGLGIAPQIVARGISALAGIPGRMEAINEGQAFTAIVDFAHTPNALRVAIESSRQMITDAGRSGRVIVIFGSAGLRDRQKRAMMARTAAELADLSFMTAEDPRTESLRGILAEMASGAMSAGGVENRTFWRIPDRGEAISAAVRIARSGDVVIACGKGHEQSMCFGTTEYPWDDRIALRAALCEYMQKPGPQMPRLPTSDSGFVDQPG